MTQVIKKALKVSDGIANLTYKKLVSFADDLQKEGALTKEEKQTIVTRISGIKKNVYDSVSGEVQRIVDSLVKEKKPKKKSRTAIIITKKRTVNKKRR